ncbi:MAG TPA: undecaprenyl/decaprenyl-phosphate alpha-N-acetylglucosaminyl 1-phosphate transferase, partial [Firmicutes bacterium]|nr:undecaprenyl/decaprenyl-phosphate alpha-N-acetylglucosaminyl 1-phosphate transferase [Bacillota bacterium]
MKDYLGAFAIALVISWLLTPLYQRLAEKLGMVDKP